MIKQSLAAQNSRIKNTEELGQFVKQYRIDQGLLQEDLAGLANTGNRFVVDLEKGKATLQLQKVLDVIDLLGLEIVVQRKTGR